MRERRSGRFLALSRRARRRSADGAGGHRAGEPSAGSGQLDWQKAHEQLGPVRSRWDLAILSNLDPETGRRPKDVLVAVNAQAQTEHTLTPQVLSARLRCLEQDGYVRHADSSAAPLRRVYYLLPQGKRLIDDLLAIVGPAGGHRSGAGASAAGRRRAGGTLP